MVVETGLGLAIPLTFKMKDQPGLLCTVADHCEEDNHTKGEWLQGIVQPLTSLVAM